MAKLSANYATEWAAGADLKQLTRICEELGITDAQAKSGYLAFLETVDESAWLTLQARRRGIPDGWQTPPEEGDPPGWQNPLLLPDGSIYIVP